MHNIWKKWKMFKTGLNFIEMCLVLYAKTRCMWGILRLWNHGYEMNNDKVTILDLKIYDKNGF